MHPQLITMPAGLFPFSLFLDVMHVVTGRRTYADAAWPSSSQQHAHHVSGKRSRPHHRATHAALEEVMCRIPERRSCPRLGGLSELVL
ncbi:hypothetical protein YTPLAS18_15900 [Nitrospira sp.]|nr:hypothetical protein YTPLAS18_15900 [Nitrospira sp.]